MNVSCLETECICADVFRVSVHEGDMSCRRKQPDLFTSENTGKPQKDSLFALRVVFLDDSEHVFEMEVRRCFDSRQRELKQRAG